MENYEIASFDNELYHWGIKGMKWGVRRYQNKDGSLTAAGQKHRTLRERVHDHKVAKKRKQSLEKARAAKVAKKEAEEKAKKDAEKRAKDIADGKISAKKMTDQELSAALTRMQNEQKYKEAMLETRPMRKLMNQTWDKAIVPAITESGKELLKKTLNKYGEEILGLNEKEKEKVKSAYELIKEEAEMAKYKKQAFQDTRDLAEMEKKYQKHLDDEATAKAQKQVDDYNKTKSAKDSEKDGLYGMKKDGENKSVPTDIPGSTDNDNGKKSNKNSDKSNQSNKTDTSDNVTPKSDVQSEPVKDQATTGKDYFNNFKKGNDIIIDVYVDSNGRARQAGEEYVYGLLEDKNR